MISWLNPATRNQKPPSGTSVAVRRCGSPLEIRRPAPTVETGATAHRRDIPACPQPIESPPTGTDRRRHDQERGGRRAPAVPESTWRSLVASSAPSSRSMTTFKLGGVQSNGYGSRHHVPDEIRGSDHRRDPPSPITVTAIEHKIQSRITLCSIGRRLTARKRRALQCVGAMTAQRL